MTIFRAGKTQVLGFLELKNILKTSKD